MAASFERGIQPPFESEEHRRCGGARTEIGWCRLLQRIAKLLEEDREGLIVAMRSSSSKPNPELARLEALLKAETRKRDRYLDAIGTVDDDGEASMFLGRVKAAKVEIDRAEASLRALRAIQPKAVDPEVIVTNARSIRRALENVDIPVLRERLPELFTEIRIDFAAAAALRAAYKTLESTFAGKPVAKVRDAKRRAAEIADEIQYAGDGPVTFVYRWQRPTIVDNTAEIAAWVTSSRN